MGRLAVLPLGHIVIWFIELCLDTLQLYNEAVDLLTKSKRKVRTHVGFKQRVQITIDQSTTICFALFFPRHQPEVDCMMMEFFYANLFQRLVFLIIIRL